MPRGIESTALANAGTNQSTAASAVGTLAPIYSQMATNPTGYTPGQMAGFNTASQQSTGGAAAGAVGQGALAAARTNNAGGYQSAVDDAARQAGVTNSQNALNVQNQNANLMLKQKEMGLSGLDSIYGTSTGAGISYLNTGEQASQATDQDVLGGIGLGIQGLTGGAMGAGALGYKPFGCWIAEAVYGPMDRRTHAVRAYLNGAFRQSWLGDGVMRLYLRHGEKTAALVHRSRVLRALFRPLFDRAFSAAMAGVEQPRILLFAVPSLVDVPSDPLQVAQARNRAHVAALMNRKPFLEAA